MYSKPSNIFGEMKSSKAIIPPKKKLKRKYKLLYSKLYQT